MLTVITKQEARALGLTRYFTGQPCDRAGHVAERLISNSACVPCSNERDRVRSKTRAYKNHRNAHLIAKRNAVREPKKCAVCETMFDAAQGNRFAAKGCSPRCCEIFQDQRAAAKLKLPDRECTYCSNMFVSRGRGQIACSDECRAALAEEARANRPKQTKRCLHCDEAFFVIGHASTGFCSEDCAQQQRRDNQVRSHKFLRTYKPELLRTRKLNYQLTNPKAHKLTTRNVNAKRIQREIEALAVAKDLIPATLAGTKGYRNKVRTAVTFLKSIGVNHPPQTGEAQCPPSRSSRLTSSSR